jgi:transposase-like protein
MQNRRKFTVEFKRKVAEYHITSNATSYSQTGFKFEVVSQSVREWVAAYKEGKLELNNAIAVSQKGNPVGRAESIIQEIRALKTQLEKVPLIEKRIEELKNQLVQAL